ncbi:MAG: response regulator [Planctomycetota bacterium]|nr:MAG: response regulator [Planctomycetota bacterium]
MAVPLKILIADHDLHFRDPLVRALRDSGVNLLIADNAHGVTRLLDSENVDAALLDLLFPGMENMELLRNLRNGDSGASNLPVILSVPRRVSKNDVNLALAYRAGALMPKPFSVQDLLDKLKGILPEERREALPHIVAEDAPIRGTTAVGDLAPEPEEDISEVDTGVVAGKADGAPASKKKAKKTRAKKKISKKKPTRTKIVGAPEAKSSEDTGEIESSDKKTEKAAKTEPVKKKSSKKLSKKLSKKKKEAASKVPLPKTKMVSKSSIAQAPKKHIQHFLDEEARRAVRVLMVDGEDPFREGAVGFLAEAGFTADGVATADEALEKLGEEKYQVLVSESAVEGEPATGFLRKVHDAYPDVSICIVARNLETVSMDKALQVGVLEYVAKPLSSAQLILAVERAHVRRASQLSPPEEVLHPDERVVKLEGELEAARDDTEHATGEIGAAIEEIQKYEHKIAKLEEEHTRLKVAYADLKSRKKKQVEDDDTAIAGRDENLKKLEEAKKETDSLQKELEAARAEGAQVREALEAAERVQSDVATAKAERDAARQEAEKTKSELKAVRTYVEETKARLEISNAEVEGIRSELESARKEAKNAVLELEAVDVSRDRMVEERDALQEKRNALQEEHAALEKKLSDRDTELAAVSIERDELGTALRMKTDQLQEVAEDREQFGMQARILEEELKGISRGSDANKADAIRLRKRIRELESSNKQLRHDLEETHSELMQAAAESAVAAAASRRETEEEITRYREALEMARREIADMAPEISTAAKENEKFISQIGSLTRERNSLKEQLDSVVELAGAGAGDAGSVELFIRNLRQERDLLERRLAQAQTLPGAGDQAFAARVAQLEEENRHMAAALAAARHGDIGAGSAAALESINTLRGKLAQVKSERDSLEAEKNRLFGLVRQLEERSIQLPASMGAVDPEMAVDNKILRAEVDELRRRLVASKPDSAALEAENQRLKELVRHFEERATQLASSQAAAGYGDPGSAAENRILKAEVEDLRRRLATAGPDNAIFEAEKARLMERVRSLEEENARLATSIASARHSEFDHGGRYSRSELDDLHGQLVTAKAERASFEAERNSLGEQIRRLQEENSRLAVSLASTRHDGDDAGSKVIRAKLEEFSSQLAVERSEKMTLEVESRRLSAELEQLKADRSELEELTGRLSRAKSDQTALESEHRKIKTKTARIEADYSAVEAQKAAMLERMGRLEEENSRLATELAAVKLSRGDVGATKIQAEYKELLKQLEESRDENSKLAAELATARFSRGDTGTTKIQAEYKELLKQLEEAREENSQLAEELAAARFGRDDAGARKIRAEYKELRRQLEEARGESSRFVAELEVANAKLSREDAGTRKIRAEYKALSNQLEEARSGGDSFDAEREALTARMDRLKEENTKLTAQLAAAKYGGDDTDAGMLRAELDELNRQLVTAREKNTKLTAGLAAAKYGGDDADARMLRAELDELSTQLATAREKNTKLTAELAAVKYGGDDADAGMLRAELDEAQNRLEREKSDRMSLEAEKRRLTARLERIEVDRDELSLTLARARSSIAESSEPGASGTDEEKEWLRGRVKELEDEVSNLHVEIEEARTIISEIEDTLES